MKRSEKVILNSTDIKVFNSLSAEDYVSGEYIAKELGVSRTMVWKTVKKIASLGLLAKAISGRGYSLSKKIALLNSDNIKANLTPLANNLFKAKVVDSICSTNEILFKAIKENKELGFNLMIAEQQTGAKGRMGRAWKTPFAHQLAFSFHWRLDIGMDAITGLSLAIGVSIVEVLHKEGFAHVGLKWPNDLYDTRTNSKLGGILIEMQREAEGPINLIIGIGLNCFWSDEYNELPNKVSSLDKQGLPVIREMILSKILNSLATMYEEIVRGDSLNGYVERWHNYNVFQGKSIVVLKGDGEQISGIDMGVSKDGCLLVKSTGKQHKVYGNLCSIRLLEDFS